MPVRILPSATVAVLLALLAGTGQAQFQHTLPAARLGETAVQRWQFGFTFAAPAGPCRKITASQSVPMDWPEQTVRIVTAGLSRRGHRLPSHRGAAKADGCERRQPRRRRHVECWSPSNAVAVTCSSRSIGSNSRPFADPPLAALSHVGPYAESSHRTIRAGRRDRQNRRHGLAARRGDLRLGPREYPVCRQPRAEPADTLTTLQRRDGDCDEMSCLFIALCRASGIPARIVQVPGHVYAEFYLDRTEGTGAGFRASCRARAFARCRASARPPKGDN